MIGAGLTPGDGVLTIGAGTDAWRRGRRGASRPSESATGRVWPWPNGAKARRTSYGRSAGQGTGRCLFGWRSGPRRKEAEISVPSESRCNAIVSSNWSIWIKGGKDRRGTRKEGMSRNLSRCRIFCPARPPLGVCGHAYGFRARSAPRGRVASLPAPALGPVLGG